MTTANSPQIPECLNHIRYIIWFEKYFKGKAGNNHDKLLFISISKLADYNFL